MPQITSGHEVIRESVEWFENNFIPETYRTLWEKLPSGQVDALSSVYDAVKSLSILLHERQMVDAFDEAPIELDESLAPCLKRALLSRRRHQAELYDSFKERTHNADMIGQLDAKLQPFDELLELDWLRAAMPMKMPRLTDFLAIKEIENSSEHHLNKLSEREYDEKFYILQAPRLFLEDLRYYREVCETRGIQLVVVYLDIDDFKRFNTHHGETQVDRRVLPRFMQTLEAHVFQHGFAYRFGGDEYVALLPNLSPELAISFLDSLRKAIAGIHYATIEETTTVSIGFCCVDSDCHLTAREIQERVNKAKNFAKANGKNCLATFTGSTFEDEGLRVVKANAHPAG